VRPAADGRAGPFRLRKEQLQLTRRGAAGQLNLNLKLAGRGSGADIAESCRSAAAVTVAARSRPGGRCQAESSQSLSGPGVLARWVAPIRASHCVWHGTY
jgi:hypothetical protein